MKRAYVETLGAAMAAFVITGAIVPFAARAQDRIEIVRPGDRSMTCSALAAEINTLGQPQKAVAEAKPKKRGGLGFLKALGAAAPMLGGMGGGVAGGIVSTVATTAGTSNMQNQVEDQMADARAMTRDAMNGGSPAQQRKERLTAIFDEKKC